MIFSYKEFAVQNPPSPSYLFDLPGRYQIRVCGTIDEHWMSEIKDLKISTTHTKGRLPMTKITGLLADQSALAGLLDLLNELGLVILTVKRLETPARE